MTNSAAKFLYPLAIIASLAVAYCMINDMMAVAAALAFFPLLIVVVCLAFTNKLWGFLLLFILNYFIPVLGNYVYDAPLGLLMDGAIAFNILVIICSFLTSKPNFRTITPDLLIVVLIWMVYCALEIFNPHMITTSAWLSSMRSMALYFFLVIILVQMSVKDLSQLKQVLAVWSVLVIISGLKVVYQKYVGFTPGDKHFLYDMDGQVTHIIYYGIRYFSIFSDAANFGGSMAMALVVFMITGFHTKQPLLKFYWWFVAAVACYGMFISGTRSALPAPVAGVMLYLVLVRDFKKMIPISILMGIVICLLAFTTIGESNSTIRRARTVFHHEEDASYIVRKENQAKLKVYMSEMPYGNSLGMSAGRAQNYGDFSPVTEIPTDSWYVQLWVETGIIGSILYFLVMGYIFIKSGITIFFRLKDPEVKGIAAGLLSGVVGLFVMSSNNEVFSQFPNGVIVYTLIGLIFMAPEFDRQAQERKYGIIHNSQL
ncbi:MAG: O-antigen ligase family protein [Bacteroidaceae bacterium]|nr:O-antigen ligase family protein [Bacteroidaceae bacterium]